MGRKHILSGIDASLRRLKMDYVDLYQIHRWDPRTPIEETMGALHDVVRSGKARYIGASSMFAWQFAKAQHTAEAHGWTKFVSMQNHYNLIYREEEREMIPLCLDQGVGVHPLEPAGAGRAGRKPHAGRRPATPRARAPTRSPTTSTTSRRTSTWSTPRPRSPRHAACRRRRSPWPGCSAKPGVTAPIVGSTKKKHLKDALAAEELTLTEDEIAALEKPYEPHPVLGHF